MSTKECPIPDLIDRIGIGGGASLKLHLTPPEIVVCLGTEDQQQLIEGLNQVKYSGNRHIATIIVEALCDDCGLCWPDIWVQPDKLSIKLRNYSPSIESNLPFVRHVDLSPEFGDQRHELRVVVIDDRNNSDQFADYLANVCGYPTRAIKVRGNRIPSKTDLESLFRLVENFKPMVVICDKGLGFADGIEIINKLKELGFITIMFTGEWQSRETSRVATHFVEKPDITSVAEILDQYWQNMQTA